jgi:hypothetical protein
VFASVAVYAAMFLVIPFIPRYVVETADGEPDTALDF